MIIGLDHVGVATGDPAAAGDLFTALGLVPGERGEAGAYAVACAFWTPPAGGAAVEVVSPLDDTSAVAGRLAREGPGLYHVAFEVDALEAELERVTGAGLVPVDKEPRAGARPGMRVAFVYARQPLGLLVELVEYGSGGRR